MNVTSGRKIHSQSHGKLQLPIICFVRPVLTQLASSSITFSFALVLFLLQNSLTVVLTPTKLKQMVIRSED